MAVAERAVKLDGRIDHLVHHMGEEDLSDGIFLPQIHALFGLIGDVKQHQASHVELAGAVGQHPLNALTIRQQAAEGRALGDMGRGKVQSPLGHGDIVHAVTQTPIGETVLTHIEAIALAAKQVLSGNDQILDLDLGVTTAHDRGQRAVRGHGWDIANDAIAGIGQLDDEG